MKCPKCGEPMIQKRWVISHWFGDVIAFELFWWLTFIPLIVLKPLVGYPTVTILIIYIVLASWGKRWYRCKPCKYSICIKVHENTK